MKIEEIFEKCQKLTMSKRHDYTSTDDNHENFKRSGEIASWFVEDIDQPYVILIGTKLARLGSLLGRKQANHESIEDTFLDLINYCALWMERRTSNPPNIQFICRECGGAFFGVPKIDAGVILCSQCFNKLPPHNRVP